MNSEMPHLRQLERMPPQTAMGRVAAAWTLIRANLAAGKRPWEVYEAAMKDGLEVPYQQFRVYVHRLRRRDLQRALAAPRSAHSFVQPVRAARTPQREHTINDDPLRNIREQRAKTKSFEFSPFPKKELTQ